MKFHRTTCNSSAEFLALAEKQARGEAVVYGWKVGKHPALWEVQWGERDNLDVDTRRGFASVETSNQPTQNNEHVSKGQRRNNQDGIGDSQRV